MRQLLYVSTASRVFTEDDLSAILIRSRYNNALDDVTGLLWSDGERFIQVLEGPSASIRETYERIANDDRHHGLIIIRDQLVEKREFGDWAMCHRRSYETKDEYDEKIERLLARVPGPVRSKLSRFMSA